MSICLQGKCTIKVSTLIVLMVCIKLRFRKLSCKKIHLSAAMQVRECSLKLVVLKFC